MSLSVGPPVAGSRDGGSVTLIRLLAIVLVSVAASGCELVVDIFQAGMVVGIIAVLLVVGVVLWIARTFRRR